MDANTSGKVRLTVDLPLEEANALKNLAAQQGVTMTQALRNAISTENLLQERRSGGSRVLLEKNGDYSELVFTR